MVGYVVFLTRHLDAALIFLGIGVVLPGVVMFAVRWIYRGFMPKKAEAES